MRRVALTLFGGFLWLTGTASAWAGAPAPPPQAWIRAGTADIIVVGKVTTIEDRKVRVEGFPGDRDTGEYTVAVVKVEEALLGAKDLTHIKVGSLPPVPGRGRFFPSAQLQKGQKVLLFLRPHTREPFLVPSDDFGVIDKRTPTFAGDLDSARRAVRTLRDPVAALKAKDAGDRLLAASVLLCHYRRPRPVPQKLEPIPAEESKLILTVLAEADWNPRAGLHPQLAFDLLGATDKDGWVPSGDYRQVAATSKKWLRDHAETFRVKRLVPAK
jgi:hypothetical protein